MISFFELAFLVDEITKDVSLFITDLQMRMKWTNLKCYGEPSFSLNKFWFRPKALRG